MVPDCMTFLVCSAIRTVLPSNSSLTPVITFLVSYKQSVLALHTVKVSLSTYSSVIACINNGIFGISKSGWFFGRFEMIIVLSDLSKFSNVVSMIVDCRSISLFMATRDVFYRTVRWNSARHSSKHSKEAITWHHN